METGKIYFQVPQKAKSYFERIINSRHEFEYESGHYYLCAIIGVLAGKTRRRTRHQRSGPDGFLPRPL